MLLFFYLLRQFFLLIHLSLYFIRLCKKRRTDDTINVTDRLCQTVSLLSDHDSHCYFTVYFRGTSNNSSMAAFRETFSDLHELRSLAPSVNIMALTATATSATRETIMDVLLMNHPHVIFESPGKPNIA